MKALGKVFNEARKHLTTGAPNDKAYYQDTEFICIAINKTSCSERSKEAAREIISTRLGKTKGGAYNHDVESWLRVQKWCNINGLSYDSIQQYRHRWLQSLVEEFK